MAAILNKKIKPPTTGPGVVVVVVVVVRGIH
jgi:hypothetical protein